MVWRDAAAAPMAVVASQSAVERQKECWYARLELGFEQRDDKTVITHRRHYGPLTLQKPFYPERDGSCHVYLLHPPGGIAGGDKLELDVDVRVGAHALITTPAATKFYKCDDRDAALQQNLRLHANSVLEWLPQETIVFDGSRAAACSRVEMETGARFIGWETVCLGRPAANENLTSGYFRQCFEIHRGDRPVLIERSLFGGGSEMLTAAWGLRGYSVSATMIALPANQETLTQVRAQVVLTEPGLFSATLIGDVLVCRYLGAQAEHARRAFIAAWRVIRPRLLECAVCEPRVWNT